jgi:hypothetical protein
VPWVRGVDAGSPSARLRDRSVQHLDDRPVSVLDQLPRPLINPSLRWHYKQKQSWSVISMSSIAWERSVKRVQSPYVRRQQLSHKPVPDP